jgi:DNA processing protein
MEKHDVQPVFFTSPQYPQRLKHCTDSPVMLYYKGNADLNAGRIVSIVGTRAPGEYGRTVCARLVEDLAAHNVIVVSGMAYGIDIIAHRQALVHDIPTIGVLAHGLDRIYPPQHKGTAMSMVENGGLLTEFLSETQPDKQHFPMRNRIVAGIADATIVVESGLQGGSLITADIANSYNKDVFAIPGRIGDPHAAGCNELIRTNRAMLITGAADVLQVMGWDSNNPPKVDPQRELFVTLNEAEQHIVTLFTGDDEKHIDQLRRESYLPGSQVTSLVLKLEMQHVLRGLPGQKYQLIN